jgi:GT2 family glycosyltransferase
MGHRHEWVMVASDDVMFPAGALAGFAEASGEDRLVVSTTWPHWCAFTIGMRVVQAVGLFDEGYYPAYFEDTEYERRLSQCEIGLTIGPAVAHDNASTLNSPGQNFGHKNRETYKANQQLYSSQQPEGFSPSRWRALSWT